jgi:peptidoglycan/LPS O-acetylase OafA/YrhL
MGMAARIDAATPRDRDRYLDLLRVLAIALVILGHWGVRVIVERDGTLAAEYLLIVAPEWQWATLIWQVMPVFFIVGGVVNARSWRRARAAGQDPVAWGRRRARRLLFPALPFLAVLTLAAAAAYATAGPEAMLLDFGVAIFPLWFLAAYLAITMLTPLTLRLHERGHGLALIAGAVALAVAVDLARFAWGGPMIGTQPAVGGVNFVVVWIVIHQIGYLWADDALPRRPAGQALLALAGAAALAAMIGGGLWPLSMVPLEGTTLPNNGSPPSAALVALALVQLGLALLLREPARRALARPRVWLPVAVTGPRLISLFMWHQAVSVGLANLLYPLGWFPVTETVDAAWWALRPLWLGLCLVVLVLVVAVVWRFETPPQGWEPPRGGAARTVAGMALFAAGIAGLSGTRFAQEAMPLDLPLVPLAAVLAGMALLGVIGRRGGGRPPMESHRSGRAGQSR